jgi:hypothetical protein
MPQIVRFDILVIGSGEAGRRLTWTMEFANYPTTNWRTGPCNQCENASPCVAFKVLPGRLLKDILFVQIG